MARQAATPQPNVRRLELSHLLLDAENPRFGFPNKTAKTQADILDNIVTKFGVDDVMSSLAVNGFFEAEPLVCKTTSKPTEFVVVEGNRRLAACLMLLSDPRASRQSQRAKPFQLQWEKHSKPVINPVPAIVFDAKKDAHVLLSYLGVRHISPAMSWDSYAKAAWVAQVVENQDLEVAEVAMMIGDQHRTIIRLLQGYYFVRQLTKAGKFLPEDSLRKGRGSVTEYPFSWVYTVLGYSTAREFVELSDDPRKKEPVPKRSLNQAALVMTAMFGDKSSGRNAAIDDSRQLGDLASALASPEKVALLRAGRSILEIDRATKPIQERIAVGLAEVRQIQSDMMAGLVEHDLPSNVARPLVDLSTKNQRAATEIEKKLKAFARSPDD